MLSRLSNICFTDEFFCFRVGTPKKIDAAAYGDTVSAGTQKGHAAGIVCKIKDNASERDAIMVAMLGAKRELTAGFPVFHERKSDSKFFQNILLSNRDQFLNIFVIYIREKESAVNTFTYFTLEKRTVYAIVL